MTQQLLAQITDYLVVILTMLKVWKTLCKKLEWTPRKIKRLPTLIISECVMIYLQSDTIDKLRKMFANYFNDVAFVDYEMFNGNDSFGKVMVRNFEVV